METKSVQTVTGPVEPSALGLTYSHEHLALNPRPDLEECILWDTEVMEQEVRAFTEAGGHTIVDSAPMNFGRDVRRLQKISTDTGILVVCTTGFHKQEFIPSWAEQMEDRALKALLAKELSEGIEGTTIRAGVMKCGTSNGHITEQERRIIRLISEVSGETGFPISTHTDHGTMGLEQCTLFEEYGVNPQRVLLGHVDIPNNLDYLIKICDRGFNIMIDHVGRRPGDTVKLAILRHLIERGYLHQIFLSGDMGKKSYLPCYGGAPGLGYIAGQLRCQAEEAGISAGQMKTILVDNPAVFFAT